eukprot:CFRG4658T1
MNFGTDVLVSSLSDTSRLVVEKDNKQLYIHYKESPSKFADDKPNSVKHDVGVDEVVSATEQTPPRTHSKMKKISAKVTTNNIVKALSEEKVDRDYEPESNIEHMLPLITKEELFGTQGAATDSTAISLNAKVTKVRNLMRQACGYWSYRNSVGRYLAKELELEWEDKTDLCTLKTGSTHIQNWQINESAVHSALKKSLALVKTPNEINFFHNSSRSESDMVTGKLTSTNDYGALNTWEETVENSGVSFDKTEVQGIFSHVMACSSVEWIIVPKAEDGNMVELSNHLEFQAEIRGPSVIIPDIKRDNKGYYRVSFTPSVVGKYSAFIRLDLARGVGQNNCVRETTKWMIAQVLTKAPSSLEVTEPLDNTQCASLNAKRRQSHLNTGEWRVVDCNKAKNRTSTKLPTGWTEEVSLAPAISTYIMDACIVGMVETFNGWYTNAMRKTFGLEDENNQFTSNCQWSREPVSLEPVSLNVSASTTSAKTKQMFMFYPFDIKSHTAMPVESLKGKWIHIWGDSLDRSAMRDSLVPLLSTAFGEECFTEFVPFMDSVKAKRRNRIRRDVAVHYWQKANVTISFLAVTKRLRISGYYMFDDKKGDIRDSWPSYSIHQSWATLCPINMMARPSAFVFNLSLHAVAHSFNPGAYESSLRHMHRWITSGAGENVPLFWRRSTVSQHHERALHPAHKCIFKSQLSALDDIAMRVMDELDVPTIDWWSVTQGRPSGTFDNRHYSDRYCPGTRVQAAQVSTFLNTVCPKI